MLLLLTSSMPVDSLSWETVKLIINSQHNLAVIGISVLVGVALLIVIINTYVGKRELSKNIKSLNSQISTNVEEMKEEIKKKGEKVFEGLTQELNKKLEDTNKEMDEKIKELENYMLSLHTAETSRLHARDAEQEKSWKLAAVWWSRAVGYSAKANAENLLGIAVRRLMKNLQKCEKLDEKDKEEIKKCLPDIPDTLSTDKKLIEKKLDELPNKAPKKS